MGRSERTILAALRSIGSDLRYGAAAVIIAITVLAGLIYLCSEPTDAPFRYLFF